MLKSIVFIQTWWVLLGLLFLKKFLSERIMNAAQAHNIQVWKEFSNIKDTYLKRLFKNIHKHQRIKENLAINKQTESLAKCLKIFLSFVQYETKIYFFSSTCIYLVTVKSSHSDSLWKCSKCLGSLCELALPERSVSTEGSLD